MQMFKTKGLEKYAYFASPFVLVHKLKQSVALIYTCVCIFKVRVSVLSKNN